MQNNENKKELTLNQETMDILVANIIPTTKYFESRFDFMQHQIDEIKNFQKDMKKDMDDRFISMKKDMDDRFISMKKDMDDRFISMKKDMDDRFEQVNKRFEQVDKRFEQVDKRFEQVDKRFEQVDKRFEQVDQKIDRLTESIQNLTLEVKELGKKQEVTIRDYIIERDRHYDQKFARHRNYFLAIVSIIITIVLKMAGIIELPIG